MNTLSNLLSSFHFFISGIICVATGATLLGLTSGTPLKSKDRLLAIGLMAFFAGTSGITWYLRQQGRHGATVAVLGIIWIGVIIAILYAISKARWN